MNLLSHMQLRMQKMMHSAQEDVLLSEFTNYTAKSIAVVREPFDHIVVDDFFLPVVYENLCKELARVKQRGLSTEKFQTEDRFHAFNMDYDGYVYKPVGTLEKDNPLSIFFSLEWNKLFEKIFKVQLGFETDFAFHHHPPGDRTGFVHHDEAKREFSSSRRLPNGVVWSTDTPRDVVRMRKIAILIYLDDGSWREGDGGETGLYLTDKTTMVKKVAPRRNRLLAFHISNKSFHAFQGNKKDRDSLIQWFHVAR